MPGSGTSKQDQTSVGQQTNAPWLPAQPMLADILRGIKTQTGNFQPTPTENQAYSQLTQNAQNLPNWAPQATDLTNQYLGGDPSGLLKPALNNYNNVLNPIASASLDPMQTPGIQNLLATIRGDVSNSVNGMFAGAGRDLSGLNQQTLARGISQGEAAPLLAQYNQNVSNATDAATRMYGAAGQTASALGENQGQAFNYANMVPGLQNASPLGVISAQGMARAAPLQNLGMLANLTVPIAGLGGQTDTMNHSVGYNTASPVQTAGGWATALGGGNGGGLLGSVGKMAGLLSIFGA